jgi:hypothetical protein
LKQIKITFYFYFLKKYIKILNELLNISLSWFSFKRIIRNKFIYFSNQKRKGNFKDMQLIYIKKIVNKLEKIK